MIVLKHRGFVYEEVNGSMPSLLRMEFPGGYPYQECTVSITTRVVFDTKALAVAVEFESFGTPKTLAKTSSFTVLLAETPEPPLAAVGELKRLLSIWLGQAFDGQEVPRVLQTNCYIYALGFFGQTIAQRMIEGQVEGMPKTLPEGSELNIEA